MKEYQRWYQLAVEAQAYAQSFKPSSKGRAIWNDIAASTRKLGDEAGGDR